MSKGVFTRNKRVTFVPGEVTLGTPSSGFVACGPGTAFPLQVTLRQLAEILYRVKDARLSGSSTTTLSFATYTMEVVGTTMPTDFYSGSESDVLVKRSYANTDDPPANLTEEDRIWRGPLSYPTDTIPAGTLASGYYDIGLEETLITGFTHYIESFAPPSTEGYDISGYIGGDESTRYPAAAFLMFGNRVAWVDANESGNPFDPNNELYVELFFDGYSIETGLRLADTYCSTNLDYAPDMQSAGELTLELSGGTSVSCYLYGRFSEETTSTVANFTMTPVAWWPYAKAGGAVWNTGTGAKI